MVAACEEFGFEMHEDLATLAAEDLLGVRSSQIIEEGFGYMKTCASTGEQAHSPTRTSHGDRDGYNPAPRMCQS